MDPRASAFALLVCLFGAASCAPPRVASTPLPKAPTLGPEVTSCALSTPGKQVVPYRNVQWIGRAGDRTWALVEGEEGAPFLIRIVEGRLEPLALPEEIAHSIVSVFVRANYLWILRTDEGLPSSEPRLLLVDVGDAKSPRVGKLESLEPLPEEGPRAFAVHKDRGLFFFGPKKQYLHWDFPTGKALSERVGGQVTSLDSPTLECGDGGCTAVMVEGDGPTRRMILRHFGGQAAPSRAEIGPGHVAEWTATSIGEKGLALWCRFDERGLWGRLYEPTTGAFLGEPFVLTGVDRDLQDPQIIPSRQGPMLAWQAARQGWRIGRIDASAHAVKDIASIPLEGSFLTAAAADDGIAIAVFTTGTDYESGRHDWYATAQATFISALGAEKPIPIPLLKDEHGPGRGGIAAHAMAAPGYAAILLTPQNETQVPASFIVFRKPC